MTESLKLRQGPGLNGLYRTAAPKSWSYDELTDTATYVLDKSYTLHIHGYPAKDPGTPLLKLETCKLLDILVCKLGDCRVSRWVELPLDEYLRLAGYVATEANKNTVRPRLKESAALLGTLSADWMEKDGQYPYRDVKLFDTITYQSGCVCACFGEEMALYLRNCPYLSLPLSLLAVSGKSPHSYFLGRRCLVHNASNKWRERHPIQVRSLLAVCPRIPRPMPGEKWSPSILERKVTTPFTTAMDTLKDSGILSSWNFREPMCRNDYEGFANSIVEFQVRNSTIPTLPAEPEAVRVCDPFDYDSFLALC